MRCPICKKQFEPGDSPAVPFCSERCRTIDLGRWLDESYPMPVLRDPDAEVPADATPADDQGQSPSGS